MGITRNRERCADRGGDLIIRPEKIIVDEQHLATGHAIDPKSEAGAITWVRPQHYLDFTVDGGTGFDRDASLC
jgi:hypothetical protein